jgi:hypothetical protein
VHGCGTGGPECERHRNVFEVTSVQDNILTLGFPAIVPYLRTATTIFSVKSICLLAEGRAWPPHYWLPNVRPSRILWTHQHFLYTECDHPFYVIRAIFHGAFICSSKPTPLRERILQDGPHSGCEHLAVPHGAGYVRVAFLPLFPEPFSLYFFVWHVFAWCSKLWTWKCQETEWLRIKHL